MENILGVVPLYTVIERVVQGTLAKLDQTGLEKLISTEYIGKKGKKFLEISTGRCVQLCTGKLNRKADRFYQWTLQSEETPRKISMKKECKRNTIQRRFKIVI